ncbi:adenine phosphoribosyltransferase [bacterium]|nr:adenine phosphoribosyltransferase [candidate division CSSED10-310 bacterium]
MDLKAYIRDIPDFPKPGIIFKDITPLLADPDAFHSAVRSMAEPFRNAGITKVVGVEARGFLFAPPIAMELHAGIVPVRKPGKLPYKTVQHTYDLEYGTDTIEIHKDALGPRDKVLIIDDLLATGGTVDAACSLVTKLGATVTGICFVIELEFLNGRKKIDSYPIHSLIKY